MMPDNTPKKITINGKIQTVFTKVFEKYHSSKLLLKN